MVPMLSPRSSRLGLPNQEAPWRGDGRPEVEVSASQIHAFPNKTHCIRLNCILETVLCKLLQADDCTFEQPGAEAPPP